MASAVPIGALAGTISLQDNFSGPLGAAAAALGPAGAAFGAIAGAALAAAGAIAATGGAIIALGQRGADVNDVEEHFRNLSAAAGSTGDVMLGALQKGTLDTISNFELMKTANSLLGSGLIKSAADMQILAAGARMVADRTGGETSEALETMTAALAKGKVATLAQYGVIVNTDSALQSYADKLGVNVKSLSDFEKKTALSQAAIAELGKQVAEAGIGGADFGEVITQIQVKLSNFTDKLSANVAASEVVMGGMNGLGKAISAAFGNDQNTLIHTIMLGVNEFAILTVTAARYAVESAILIRQGWDLVAAAFKGVGSIVTSQVGNIVSGLGLMLEALSRVPGYSSGLAIAGAELRKSGDELKATSGSLVLGAMEHGAAVLVENETLRTLAGSLQDTIAGMEVAQANYGKTVEVVEKVTKTHADLTGEIDRQRVAAEEAAEAFVQSQEKQAQASMDSDEKIKAQIAASIAEMAMLRASDSEQRVLAIDTEHQLLIERVTAFCDGNLLLYQTMVAGINATYEEQRAQAVISNEALVFDAQFAGEQLRVESQKTAWDAIQNAQAIAVAYGLASNQYKEAFEKAEDAVRKASGETTADKLKQFQMIASASSSILKSIFGKNKAAAYAAAIIETAAAVITSFKNGGGYPWGLIPAAAMAAAGAAQIAKISSQDAGFAKGTPGTAFEDFGGGSLEMLHGQEAVVTVAQGETLAGMIGAEIRGARGQGGDSPAMLDMMTGLRRDLRALPAHIARATRDAIQTAPA